MPAWSTRIFVLTRAAVSAGLAFETPGWWDVDRLFELNADRLIRLPDGRQVLLIAWPRILQYDPCTGRKAWACPESEEGTRRHWLPERVPSSAEEQARRQTLLDAVQVARWFVIERTKVWIVPEEPRAGCAVFQEPYWWEWGHSLYREFWSRHWETRFLEQSNPVYAEYVALFTGEEIRGLDRSTRGPFWAWWSEQPYNRTREQQTWLEKEMRRLEEALTGASWVVLYHYEWESGL